jgi:RND family efflux transporter MFP subunit
LGQQEKIVGRPDLGRAALRRPVEPVVEPGQETGAAPPLWHRIVAALLQGALALAVIAGGYVGYQHIMAGTPVAERAERPRTARLVETVPAVAETRGPVIGAWGEVTAAQALTVRPEVSGTLVWVNPDVAPGGLLEEGEVIARFDTRDLELSIRQAEATIAGIEARIRIERGQSDLGRRDLERLSRNISDEQRALVLREPQMAQLEAELAAARAALAQAGNQLARAEVRAPFDAVVISESVEPGAMLSQGAEIGQIVATDRFDVRLSVPASVLDWIDLGGGQAATLRQPAVWPEDTAREGRIARLGAALSETGRTAELIVEVPDPLALAPENAGKPRLLLGAYVEGAIAGAPVEDAVSIERAWLREGDTVWVMNEEDRLEVRPVDVAWRGADGVLIRSGLAPGERIVTTPLATHAEGMELRVREDTQ